MQRRLTERVSELCTSDGLWSCVEEGLHPIVWYGTTLSVQGGRLFPDRNDVNTFITDLPFIVFLSGLLALPHTLPLRICTLTFIVSPPLCPCILFPCPCVPAVESVSAPEMLHDDVVAWMQQVRKAVQSVSEHNGSE